MLIDSNYLIIYFLLITIFYIYIYIYLEIKYILETENIFWLLAGTYT